ncbi:protein CHLOROPLAST IMPORT APPARATUS 2-like [Silene latifolia]|uniref:protein CHLOROPLAST IMPORT APPARATUS 2-like n=1 Tax=Silene latifolia TaxID=37657 RepID=UPI003D785AF7
MSSCLSGGGRTAYGINLDIIIPPSTSSRSSHSSSPSSTISESSNSPLAISTRKPRTPRKRPNQIYSEAATLLSTAYPNIFSATDLNKPCKFIKPHEYSSFSFSFEDSSDEVLMPSVVDKPSFQIDSTAYENPCSNLTDEYVCQANTLCDGYDDFDAESILDEETEEGVIDSIMGNFDVRLKEETDNSSSNGNGEVGGVSVPVDFCYGYPLGLGLGLGGRFDFGFGMIRGGLANPFRQNDEGEWWRFPVVNVGEISPRLNEGKSPEKKKKKKKKMMKLNAEPSSPQREKKPVLVPQLSSITSKEHSESNSKSFKENSVAVPKSKGGMLLKLNINDVLDAWSDKGSVFSEDVTGSEFSGSDALVRLAQIDLFGESGALREASVQRYKEKRRTRLFSKKIRYQVRKVNADQRPRMKGRFVRRLNSPQREE